MGFPKKFLDSPDLPELFEARTGFQELFKAKSSDRVTPSKSKVMAKVTRRENVSTSPHNQSSLPKKQAPLSPKHSSESPGSAEAPSAEGANNADNTVSMTPPAATDAQSNNKKSTEKIHGDVVNGKNPEFSRKVGGAMNSLRDPSESVVPKVNAALEYLDEGDQVLLEKVFGLRRKENKSSSDLLAEILRASSIDSCSQDDETLEQLADILRALRKCPKAN